MHERLKVVVVGGDRTAAQLVTDFTSRAFVEVVAVADMYDDSPGAVNASRLGIPFTTAVAELADLAPDADLVIDMAQWPEVGDELRTTYPHAASGSPTVIHDAGARLVLGLAAESSDAAVGGASAPLVGADC